MSRPPTLIDANRQVVRCERCGNEIPIPLGLTEFVIATMKGFDAAHKYCHEGDPPRCYFSIPEPKPPINFQKKKPDA